LRLKQDNKKLFQSLYANIPGEYEMKHLLQLAVGLSLLASLPVLAMGDADAGQGKAAICAACHGIDGNSAVPNWPKLGGQHSAYLERQVSLVKSGNRQVPEMMGIVAALTDEDIADIAAYYSSQPVAAGLADETLLAAGEQIYRAGIAAKDVPACMSCHGPAGRGNPLSGYPSLAGQHAVYSEKMLKGFRAGTTWGEDDTNSITMTQVANRLTDNEIKAVSSYIQGLHTAE
jgi:cytochrome c553